MAVLTVSCEPSPMLRDHSFTYGITIGPDVQQDRMGMTIALTSGNPEEAFTLDYLIDGDRNLVLEKDGSPFETGSGVLFRDGEAALTLPELRNGRHSIAVTLSNGWLSRQLTSGFESAPDAFSYEAKVLTENIPVTTLEIRFTRHDSEEEYRASVSIDGELSIRDTLLAVPSSGLLLENLRPGMKDLVLSVHDSYRTVSDTIRFEEPARTRYMDLVLDVERDQYTRPETYRVTAKRSGLPYRLEIGGDFEFIGQVDVTEQKKEGARPLQNTYSMSILKPVQVTLTFDGSSRELMDAKAARKELEMYSRPSIMSWDWNEWADWYTPNEVMDVPYHLYRAIPHLKLKHEGLPGIRIRIENNTGMLTVNNVEYSSKEIII